MQLSSTYVEGALDKWQFWEVVSSFQGVLKNEEMGLHHKYYIGNDFLPLQR